MFNILNPTDEELKKYNIEEIVLKKAYAIFEKSGQLIGHNHFHKSMEMNNALVHGINKMIPN